MDTQILPDDLDLTVFFESEPFYQSPDHGIVSYIIESPVGQRMEVSFDRIYVAVFIKIFEGERLFVEFGTEGLSQVVLHDDPPRRLIECRIETTGASGTVRVEISPDFQLTSNLMNMNLNRQ